MTGGHSAGDREAFAYRPGGRKLSAFPYPGGKTTYCDEIISRLPEHRRYVEPFGGSAAVLLNKPTSYIEVYNDLDDDVVHFFEVLRDRREDLQEWLYRTPFSRSVYEDAVGEFYDGERPADDVERAGKWFYLRYSQYNGALDRRNGFKTGGKRNEARSFRGSINALDHIADRFAEVTLEAEPYETVIDRYDAPDTVFYCDPPYYNTRSDRAHYRVGEDFDHGQFIDTLRDRDGRWIVSYGDLPPGLEDLAETVATYTAMYSMSYDDKRQQRTEHLAMNYDPDDEPEFTDDAQTTLEDAVVAADGDGSCGPTAAEQSEGGGGR
jgi:DNA adenine methylase